MSARRTIARDAVLEGIGLHLGHACRLVFRAAPAGSGIRFRRTDLEGSPEIPARVDRAVLSERRTQLGDGPASLHTVEHVLAAIAGLEIDDLTIEMDAPEPPIMDGSARPFLDALQAAGVVETGGRADHDLADRLAIGEHAGLVCQGVLDLQVPLADVEFADVLGSHLVGF